MSNKAMAHDIDAARNRAARFYICNLHAHSPASHDYGNESSLQGAGKCYDPLEEQLDHKSWITKILSTDLEVMAITDHNVCGWACQAAMEWAGAQPHESPRCDGCTHEPCPPCRLTVLPGCEVHVKPAPPFSSALHMLAIFDPAVGEDHVNRIFSYSKCPSTEAERGQGGYSLQAELKDVVSTIVDDLGGVCIFAHVGSTNGVRDAVTGISLELLMLKKEIEKLGAQKNRSKDENRRMGELQALLSKQRNSVQNQYLQFLIESRVSAIQVSKPEDASHYTMEHIQQFGAITDIPCILATDSHRLCDVALSDHLTYIKMATPSAQGLKKAFTDPAARIRFSTNPPPTDYPRIFGVRFVGSQCFFNDKADLSIGFSDNLTCIIGGRGSGKSCIIEGLRFLYGQKRKVEVGDPNSTLAKKEEERHHKYLSHLFSNTSIQSVCKSASNSLLVIKRTYGGSGSGDPIAEEIDGHRRQIHIQSAPELKVDIYGQAELESLAKDKEAQRLLLDSLVPDVDSMKDAIEGIRAELAANRDECTAKARQIKQLNAKLTRLNDTKAEISRLSNAKLDPLAKQQGFADSVGGFGTGLQQKSETMKTELDLLLATLEGEKQRCDDLLNDTMLRDEPKFRDNVTSKIGDVDSAIVAAVSSVEALQNSLSTLEERLTALIESVETVQLDISAEMRAISTVDYESKAGEASDDGSPAEEDTNLINLIELREQHQAAYRDMLPDEVARDAAYDELQRLLNERRNKLLQKWNDATKRLYDARISIMESIRSELALLPGQNLEIRLDLHYQQDRSAFVEQLGEKGADKSSFLYGDEVAGKKWENEWARHFAARWSSSQFVQIFLDRNASELSSLTKEGGSGLLGPENIDNLVNARSPFGASDKYEIDPSKLDKLLMWEENGLAEDLPEISLADRPIEGLSPGQRCSALLPIILLSGDWPIVIDQPEDNLDNQHIFDCLVEILRVLKHRRQIICATHNANIVVSGDAEQVIVCHAEDEAHGRILRQASIDDEDSGSSQGIISYVKAIMEGGERAFEFRANFGII